MARKASTAKIPGTSIPYAAPAAAAPPAAAPKAKRPLHVVPGDAIDPASRDARKRLDERYPRVTNAETIDAPPAGEYYAARYLTATAEVARLEAEKELCGNHLRAMIQGNAGIEGFGFKASWFERVGEVDWKALAKTHGISEETIDSFRKPGGRSLRVTGKG